MGRARPSLSGPGSQHRLARGRDDRSTWVTSDLPRRNGWTIAKRIGDRTPDRTQRLLNRACRDEAAAMSAVRRFAVSGLDEAARRSGRSRGLAVGALDETGQEKHGQATAGVQRQHMGCAGGVENGINRRPCPYIPDQPPPAHTGMIALTVPEARSLIAATRTPLTTRPRRALVRLDAQPSSPSPLVPPQDTACTRPEPHNETPGQLTNGGCRTRGVVADPKSQVRWNQTARPDKPLGARSWWPQRAASSATTRRP
jgi:hypothetical protein